MHPLGLGGPLQANKSGHVTAFPLARSSASATGGAVTRAVTASTTPSHVTNQTLNPIGLRGQKEFGLSLSLYLKKGGLSSLGKMRWGRRGSSLL